MAQIKIYGARAHLTEHRSVLSDCIHQVAQDALGLPEDKRFHRFIPLDPENFIYPADRSGAYTIIEISMFEGRDPATKRSLVQGLIAALSENAGLAPQDIEITVFETPKSHWGIRGKVADALTLNYKVEV
jgi:phenylpyruvate tautomerase PptA (4-oxalocrotonate tautomerase family)